MHWSTHTAGTLLFAVAAAAGTPPAAAASAEPEYAAEPCCALCPRAADPDAYSSSQYLSDFRVLVQGRDGWLFRTGMDLTTRFDVPDQSLSELRRLADALHERGTELVLVYQPPRGLMDPDKLKPEQRRAYDFEQARRNYAATLERLRVGGAVTVPPLDRLVDEKKGYDYYFRRDHHWTPAGAEHTAKLIAETVKALPAFAKVPRKEFTTREAGVIAKPGTLQKVATEICGGGYSMQYLPMYVTDAAGGGSDLLGDSAAPEVALVGTSNSDAKGGYNFGGYLEQYLGADVIDAAISGGSFEGSLLHYLPSEEFQKHPPKILVWEIPYQNYPNSEKNPHKIFRQAVPLVNDGCRGKPLVLSKTIPVHQGSNELLFNGGGRILPLVGRDYQLEFQFSETGVKDLHAMIWYLTGQKESLKLHFNQYVDNGSRFVAELRTDRPDYAAATMMGTTLEIDQAPDKPMTLTAQLCAREHAPDLAAKLAKEGSNPSSEVVPATARAGTRVDGEAGPKGAH